MGNLGDHESTYRAVNALKVEYPGLMMNLRPNLKGEYVLPPREEDFAVLLCCLAEEGNKVLLLDPSDRRHKMGLERYPLNLLDAVKAHPQVASN